MRALYARGLIAAVLLVLAGCAAFAPKLEAPRLALVSASMTSGDIFSQNFLVRMHVQNPNDRDLPIRGIDYRLFLEGDSFAEGVTPKAFVVPANGETEFDITVRTNFVSSIGRLLTRLQGKQRVQYVIEGKVLTDIGMLKKIPFRESGTVDLATVR
ncbi:MAG: LEA type 2 family protein [Xanthomonadaceae bacterium]|nr:LEA type 2 family protein [Xanthomonadaceae bacterium]